MVRSKLAEFGGRLKLPITVIGMGARFKIGPFDLELVTMSHSIPEPSAVVVRTPLGLVFHTADWKLDKDPLVGDPTDVEKIRRLGEEGVLALVCDSTNAFRAGTSPSEAEVARSITRIITGAKRRVAVTTFASNVARIKAVAYAAEATGRRLLVVGRAMHRVIEVAIDTGYLPASFTYLDQTEFSRLEAAQVLALCTGSQGEARAAMARIGEGEHPDVKLTPGDLVIFSSRTIPGNEKAVGRVLNNLARMGCDIVTDNEALVHVTGHPRREELHQMYQWLRPKVAIPMHGEVRHLKAHGRIAEAEGVKEVITAINGEIVRIGPGPAQLVDEAPVGRLFRDGRLIVADGEGPVRERRKLAFAGIVVVALSLGRKGELVGEPDCTIDGVPAACEDGYAMEDVVLDAVEGTWRSIPAAGRRDTDKLKEAVRRSVRSAVEQAWGKRPVVKVLILQP
jgi:ribonuclease J